MTTQLGWLVRFMRDTNSFQRPWRELLGQLGEGQREDVRGVIQVWNRLKSYAGPIGGSYFDLTKPTFSEQSLSRLEVQLVTGAVIIATSKTDDIVDEHGLGLDERVATIQELFTTLTDGKSKEWRSPETAVISLLLLYIHQKISATPYGDLFFDEFGRVKDAALKQTTGQVSLEQAMELGSAYAGTLMSIPYCWDQKLPKRFLDAAHHFGAYIQIFDDLGDARHDKVHGIRTAITQAESHAEVAEARSIAIGHYKESLAALEPGERSFYRALDMIMKIERIRTNHLPYHAREIREQARAL